MNMLIGVLCEVIGVVSAVEKEAMKVTFVKAQVITAFKDSGVDIKEDMVITKQEFEDLLMKPATAKAIRAVGVDPVGLVDFCEFIFSGECAGLNKSDLKE